MVKELTETRILSPPPKKTPREDMRGIPNIMMEGNATKSINNSKPTKLGKKPLNKKKKDNNSSNADSKNDTRELKHNISVLKEKNSKVNFLNI